MTLQLPPLQQCLKSTAWHVRSFTNSRLILALLAALYMANPAMAQISFPTESAKPHTNEQILTILRQMAEAYARMPSLQIRSVYTSTLLSLKPEVSKASVVGTGAGDGANIGATLAPKPNVPATGSGLVDTDDDSPNRRVDRTVKLLYVQPNLLKITDSRTNATNPAEISTWVSDGKTYSAFVPRSHNANSLLYTQEKAPHSIRGFAKLQNLDGGSLELVMLMGINPFQNLTPEIATTRLDEPATVRGVETEVVTMTSVTRTERDVLHLYIGKEDHLLHRFISEVSPTESASGGARIGDALDEVADESRSDNPPAAGSDKDHPLDPGDISSGERNVAKRTRVVYDNLMTPVTHVEREEFAFTPPLGAALFRPLGSKQIIDPNSKRLAEIIRKSMEGHSKPVHDVLPLKEVSP